jgi:hypothetical protein
MKRSLVAVGVLLSTSFAYAEVTPQFAKIIDCKPADGSSISAQVFQQVGNTNAVFVTVKTKDSGETGSLGTFTFGEQHPPQGGITNTYEVESTSQTGFGGEQSLKLVANLKAYNGQGEYDEVLSKSGTVSIEVTLGGKVISKSSGALKCEALL